MDLAIPFLLLPLACTLPRSDPGPPGAPPVAAPTGVLPTFKNLAGDGALVPLTVHVVGATTGQVDFRPCRDGQVLDPNLGESLLPPLLHVEPFTSPAFTIQVPAHFHDPIMAIAIAHEPGRPPADGDPYGTLVRPFRPDGRPLEITLRIQPDQVIHRVQPVPTPATSQLLQPPTGPSP